MSPLFAQTALPPPDVIRKTAEEVVSRPYFELDSTARRDSTPFVLELIRWILAPFRWLFESLEGLPEFVRWLVVVVTVVICIALTAHIIYTLIVAIRGPTARHRRQFEQEAAEVDPLELERQAESVGKQGDYIGAIRLLFRSALRRIELAERNRFRPGFTNRELLRRYRMTPLYGSLERFVDTIEMKWYGNIPCEQIDYQSCRSAHVRICEFVRQSGSADPA